jgi:hypothetical protein
MKKCEGAWISLCSTEQEATIVSSEMHWLRFNHKSTSAIVGWIIQSD